LLPKPIGRTGGNLPHGHTAGYLGKQFDPFILNADPNSVGFKVPDLLPPDYISSIRAERRQKLRDAVDGATSTFERSGAAKQLDDNFKLAYRLISSAKAREAFAIEKETSKLRDRYGHTRFGQSCLMARRLIESGVRFVTVNMFETVFDEVTWDIHGSRPFTDVQQMAKEVAPTFDMAYSALLEDLDDRGLLSTTMVIALGEFGRTPKINPAGGRDHHPGVWSILLGGGPLKGGQVIGESDELGYAPKSRPITPGEVAATLYRGLGLDPHKELPGPQNRPLPLAEYSLKPIDELF
jgi:hypothetical protein